mgnify:CR=1 FL=1
MSVSIDLVRDGGGSSDRTGGSAQSDRTENSARFRNRENRGKNSNDEKVSSNRRASNSQIDMLKELNKPEPIEDEEDTPKSEEGDETPTEDEPRNLDDPPGTRVLHMNPRICGKFPTFCAKNRQKDEQKSRIFRSKFWNQEILSTIEILFKNHHFYHKNIFVVNNRNSLKKKHFFVRK